MVVKLVSLVKRKAGLSRADFMAYYETHHVKLGEANTAMCGYRRNYVCADDPLAPLASPLDFDVITESIFPDHAALLATADRCGTPEMRAVFAADEEKFIDRTVTRTFVVDVHETDTGRLNQLPVKRP